MKKTVLSTVLILHFSLLFATIPNSTLKGIPIVWGTDFSQKKIVDLPDAKGYTMEGDKEFDLGYYYEYYHVLWVPLYIIDGSEKIVGLIPEDNESYVILTDEELQKIKKDENLEFESPSPDFWHQYGGKLILGIIILLIIWSYIPKRGD